VTVSVLIIILLGILGLYSIAMSRTSDHVPPSRQRWYLVSFTLGLVVSLVTFIPAPDLFGPDHRFTVSMGQMLLAIDLGPPLLLLGIPSEILKPLLRRINLENRLKALILFGLLSTAILWGWFVPVLFEAASSNLNIWILKQMLILVSGLVLWWPVAGSLPTMRPEYPAQLIYLFVMRFRMFSLGIIFTFANRLIYSSRSFALELCAPSSVSDQQVGGLIMWIIGGMIEFAALMIIFIRWFGAESK
jgi:cytochrome c oxidase assembly factor CtaG